MEHQLELRIPCWVIAEGTIDDIQQASQIVLAHANGKNTLQVFLEKPEAERFIKSAGLTNKIPLTISAIQHFAQLTDHLQKQGAHAVQIISQAGDQVTQATVRIGDFNDGLRKLFAESKTTSA